MLYYKVWYLRIQTGTLQFLASNYLNVRSGAGFTNTANGVWRRNEYIVVGVPTPYTTHTLWFIR